MTDSLRILGLQVENFMALKAVSIRPDRRPVTEITGKNAQGKTSILTAIQAALGGKRALVDESGEPISDPLRHGAKAGRIFLDIGHLTRELSIEVHFTNEDWKLTVRNAAGKAQSSPQTILNALYNSIAFDPESFMRMKPADQVETLRKLVGIDWTELDKQEKAAREERVVAGRQRDAAAAVLANMPFHAVAPEAERGSQELVDQLTKAQLHNRDAATFKARLDAKKQDVVNTVRSLEACKKEIARLEAELVRQRELLVVLSDKEVSLGRDMLEIEKAARDFVAVDEVPIRSALANIEADNSKVRQNSEHSKQNAAVQGFQHEYDRLSNVIQGIAEQRAGDLEFAEFPMEGLTFADDRVLFKGIPLNQRSAAEKSRIAVAIAAALNPKLPVVLIRNGSLYDSDSMAALCDEAEKRKLHVFMEIVDSDSPSAVVIEGGEVKV